MVSQGDIFAEALLEDLTPRIEPRDLELSQSQLPVAQQQINEAKQQEPEVASVQKMTSQKSKRAKELQEPAPVTGKIHVKVTKS